MSTAATSAADFTWNPSLGIRILTQLFCIGAIELCCERQLALWTAIKQASPPTTVVKTAPKPPVPRTWQQRWKNNAINIGMMIMPVPGLLGAFKKGALIPHYLIDGLWLGIMMWVWTKAFASALYGIFPRARSVHRLRRSNDAKNWDFEVETVGPTSGHRWTNPHVNLFAGFLCSALLLTSSYFGSSDLLPLACAAQIISALVSWYAPQFKMKVLVMLQAGVILLFAFVYGIVFLVGTGKKSSPQDMAEFAKAYPAPWLLRIMAVVSFNLIYSIPGAFMQVNMRYEHSRVASAPTPSAPGEAVLVNHKAAVPALPLYRFTIFALIACCLTADAWSYYTSSENFAADHLLLLLMAIPAIVGGTAVYTFFRGDFKDWWNYSEKYRPEIDLETVKEVDEDGKEVGAETADEKRPITP